MTRSRVWVLGGVLLLAVFVWASTQPRAPGVSSYGRHAAGWMGLWAYLREVGVAVERHELPLTEREPGAGELWLMSMPCRVALSVDEEQALIDFLGQGGVVLLALSGQQPGVCETSVLQTLSVQTHTSVLDGHLPPFGYLSWRDWVREGVVLDPVAELPPVTIRPGLWRVDALADAQATHSGPGGRARVLEARRHGGEVVVLDNASALGNSRLADNLPWLHAVLEAHDVQRVVFDEWRQGFASPDAPPLRETPWALLALVLHALGLYALAVFVLSRPWGPRRAAEWSHPRGARQELEELGAWHARGGHAEAAGRALQEARAQAMRRRGRAEEPLPPAHDEMELMQQCRAVARQRRTRWR